MRSRFVSLDRHVALECEWDRPDRYREIHALRADQKYIPRGAGLSYVAASFSDRACSIDLTRFNHILDFNSEEQWIKVEAGISLGELFDFLSPRGLQLAVMPGHPQITVGGCIAGNVHGKNQFREGEFRAFVREIQLFHPDHGEISASPSVNPEVFDLTCGGFGLTGIIIAATLALSRLPGNAVRVQHFPVGGLDEAFREVARRKEEFDLLYGWCNLSAWSRWSGSGFITAGNIETDSEAGDSSSLKYSQLNPSSSRRWRPRVFRPGTLPLVNAVYLGMNLLQRAPHRMPLSQFLFPAVGKEFYFDYYGDKGFIEMQVLVPSAAAEEFVREFTRVVRGAEGLIGLTTVKASRGKQRLLHYTGTGFNFTVDVANTAAGLDLLGQLDVLNTRHGGITNIIKDSRLSSDVARQQFTEFDEFHERLLAFDPARRFVSAVSERLAL